jgi:hypothetical protein
VSPERIRRAAVLRLPSPNQPLAAEAFDAAGVKLGTVTRGQFNRVRGDWVELLDEGGRAVHAAALAEWERANGRSP